MQWPTRSQSGGIVTILVVALLLAVAAGLYLQLILQGGDQEQAVRLSESTVSVQVLEGGEPASPEPPVADTTPLPDEQMAMIMRVFAPEIGD
mgnify:CR=1 FL=1